MVLCSTSCFSTGRGSGSLQRQTERRLAKQDAMAGLVEAAETPAKDPEVTELELEESELAAADDKMQAFLAAGGIPEGNDIQLRSNSCKEGVAGKNKSPAGDVCEHTLVEQCAVVAANWEQEIPTSSWQGVMVMMVGS